MITYYLTIPFSDIDLGDDDIEYTSLDRARDVAFELASEYGQDVRIIEVFGQSENLIETVSA